MNKIMYKCYGVFDRNKCIIIIIIIIIIIKIIKIIIARKTKPVPTAKSEQLIIIIIKIIFARKTKPVPTAKSEQLKIIKISTKTIPVPTVGRNS